MKVTFPKIIKLSSPFDSFVACRN